MATPLVFARDRTDVEAHARDYARLLAVAADRSGRYERYLLLYRWSTVDLRPAERMPVGLGLGKILRVPVHADFMARAYAIDGATLRFIAASRELRVAMPQETPAVPFALWKEGRSALRRYLDDDDALAWCGTVTGIRNWFRNVLKFHPRSPRLP